MRILLLFIFVISSCSDSSLNHITPLGAHSLVFHKKGYIVDIRSESKFSEVPDKAHIISEMVIIKNEPTWIKIYSENENKSLILCCGEKEEFANLSPYISKNKIKAFYISDLDDWKNKGLYVDKPRKLAEE